MTSPSTTRRQFPYEGDKRLFIATKLTPKQPTPFACNIVMEDVYIYVGLSVIFFVFLLRMYSAKFYDIIIIHMTSLWYEAVFMKIAATMGFNKLQNRNKGEPPFRLLDVGIGTATALLTQKRYLEGLNTKVVGVDYDAEYVAAARQSVSAAGLSDRVIIHCCSIYEATPVEEEVRKHGKFDAVYFSGSFSLMPDPLEALLVVAKYVKSGGFIYITQTFQKKSFPGASIGKPLLKYITTIDFGQLFFETQLEDVLRKSGLKVCSNHVIPRSVDNRWQSARCITLQV